MNYRKAFSRIILIAWSTIAVIFFMCSITLNTAKANSLINPAENYGAGNGPRSVAISDLNGDGDLAVANGGSDNVSILINTGQVIGPACYTYVADEGESFYFTETVDVAYGANGQFNYLYGVTGTITFDNTTFGDPIYGVVKAGFYKNADLCPVGPDGYTYVADEGDSFNFTETVDVAYGANGQFNYLYGVTGTITFDNTTFGDPIYGVVKAGFYKNADLCPVGPDGYTYVADEGDSFNFTETVDVAYGANGQFNYLYGVSGTITFDNETFGDPIYGVVKAGFYKNADLCPVGPDGYTYVADEGDSFNFTETVDVAYGANGQFNYLYGVTGTITFDNETFGDPIYGVVKAGFYRSAAPVGPDGYTYVADEGESVTFTETVDVAYGANGQFNYLYGVTGTITFDNETFGDPIYGVVKAGFYRPAGPVLGSVDFLIITASPLYPLISSEISVYQGDIAAEGWSSEIITVNKTADGAADVICPTAADLKQVIADYYHTGLQGFVIIGSHTHIPTAYWHYHQDHSKANPVDLYYADMDEWINLEQELSWIEEEGAAVAVYETYHSTQDGQADEEHPANPDNFLFQPELFFGRISAGPVSVSLEDEALKVATYLNKIHDYRLNGSSLSAEQQKRAAVIVDDEWVGFNDAPDPWLQMVPHVTGHYDLALTEPGLWASELQRGYHCLSLVSHSGPNVHYFNSFTESQAYVDQFTYGMLQQIEVRAHLINLFNCTAAKFIKENMAAGYLFNPGDVLITMGCSGSLGLSLDVAFGRQINNGATVGSAFQDYLYRTIRPTGWSAYKTYGILMGDPLLKLGMDLGNMPPKINNRLFVHEASAGNQFELVFDVTDPENDPVVLDITDLPENAVLLGNELLWTPGPDQVGQTFEMTVTAADSHGGSYAGIFSVYVSYFQNGLLHEPGTAGWLAEGDPGTHFLPGGWLAPHKVRPVTIQTNSSWGNLTQLVEVEANTIYKFNCYVREDLNVPQLAGVHIVELDTFITIGATNGSYRGLSLIFSSQNNTSLTFVLCAGDNASPVTGTAAFSGLGLYLANDADFQLQNGNFEAGEGNLPENWSTYEWTPVSVFTWEEVPAGRGGTRCVSIQNPSSNDSRWRQRIYLFAGAQYEFSGWVKSNSIDGAGANLSVIHSENPDYRKSMQAPRPSPEWSEVTFTYTPPVSGYYFIECRLGYFGATSTGQAWFDDLTVTRLP